MAFLERNLDQLGLVQKQVRTLVSTSIKNLSSSRSFQRPALTRFLSFVFAARRPEHCDEEGGWNRREEASREERTNSQPRTTPPGRRSSTCSAERQVRGSARRDEGEDRGCKV